MSRHLLLFDIDGTLLHAGGAGRLALSRALRTEFGLGEPAFEELGFAGRTDRAIASEALRRNGLEPEEPLYQRYLDAYLTHLPKALRERTGQVLPGATDLLAALAGREDVALGILTGNIEEAARLKLAHFELAGFFPGGGRGGFGDHHHDRDHVARDADLAMREYVAEDACVWVIGDTPLDVRCARAIGARAIAVCTGFSSREELEASKPDHLLDDLRDVARFLSLLDEG